MKKILFVLLSFVISVSCFGKQQAKQHHSQQSYDYYNNEYASGGSWSFHTTDTEIGDLGFVILECDKHKKFWLKYEVITPFNVKELTNKDGNICFGQYNIYENKHMYIKLDNNEILTFTCAKLTPVKDGYYTGNNGIYQKYDIYSYFDITQEQINKLCEHKIIKMRCELKYNVMDMNLDSRIVKYPNEKFNEYYNKMLNKLNEKLTKDNNQQQLNENPLYNF